jgi:tungstate transport system ATP-binding protein
MNGPPLISITNLVKDFGDQRVLDIPELHFERGRIYALTGHNGSGKTTLLRIIAGLEEPSCGSVSLCIDKKHIGFCFQKPYMFRGSVEKNVTWGMDNDIPERLHSIAEKLQIENLLRRSAKKLSAGEMQKVSMARMLVRRPELLLLDEPTAHLDAQGIRNVEEVILCFVRGGGTCIAATHMAGHASRLSADVIRLEEGSVAA